MVLFWPLDCFPLVFFCVFFFELPDNVRAAVLDFRLEALDAVLLRLADFEPVDFLFDFGDPLRPVAERVDLVVVLLRPCVEDLRPSVARLDFPIALLRFLAVSFLFELVLPLLLEDCAPGFFRVAALALREVVLFPAAEPLRPVDFLEEDLEDILEAKDFLEADLLDAVFFADGLEALRLEAEDFLAVELRAIINSPFMAIMLSMNQTR